MAFKALDIADWPTDSLREFCAVINTDTTTPEVIDDLSEILLGVKNPPIFNNFAELLVAAGLFTSKGQANKAGAQDTIIDPGLSCFKIGKLKTAVWIWKPV